MNIRLEDEPLNLGDPDSWPKSQFGFKDVVNAIKQRLFPKKTWETPIEEKVEAEPQVDLT
ncbi:hypothetical protein A3A79_02130 [Candidatus Gottesmanbacteria bacterium RIFCSPLOWO2_01_FULL_43_11b]|uniref:Uncharacterized protein n=1 Tax=Candidatus Gottesmanbacteria bacterium RIFCSPLOWO2_01_FULL_43_11b TaxID=1798392 RepID=A0A1F6AHA0_9BACT|nr:MAG: hypothetical protein A3A79_02130 [Candidatus Gottesmanbacteria bacterium RIFCSPLOWO2_01_FULL_43_11b]